MKVFASDYDGTIKVNGTIDKDNIMMMKKWRSEGNHFGIVSGRSVESMVQEIEEYKLEIDFLICNNGGVVYDKEMNLLKTFEIALDTVKLLVDEMRAMDINSFVLNDGYYKAKEVVNCDYEDYKYGTYSSNVNVEDILRKGVVCQIVISVNDNALGIQLAKTLNAKYTNEIEAYPNIHCVDIVPSKVSKARGIAIMQEHMQYDTASIYVMGDALNDLSMLETYQGAILSHAMDEMKLKGFTMYDSVAAYLTKLMQ